DGDGIVQRGLAFRLVFGKGCAQPVDVVGERKGIRETTADLVVEVDNENLVLWIAGFDKRDRRLNHVLTPGRHTTAVVDHQTYRDGYICAGELSDLLQHAIFVDLKLILSEARDVTAAGVFD